MFLLLKGELENRLDPLFYSENIFSFLKTTTFEVKKIKEINTFVKAGFGVGRQDQDLEQNGYIQIRPTNLDEDGFLKFEKNIYLPESYLETNKTNILEKEDVLFNNTNSQELVGKTAYFEEEGIFLHSNHITIIRVNKEIILPKYLWILLNIYQKRKIFFNICTNWNNQSGVGIDRLLSLKIPVPNLETQQTIINIFEKAYALKKANEKKAKALLVSIDYYLLAELGIILPEKEENTLKNRVFLRDSNTINGNRIDSFYHQIYFQDLINTIKKSKYRIGKLGDEIKEINYGASFSNSYVEKGVPLLRIKDLRRNEIVLDKIVYLPESARMLLGNSFVKTNDFLISRSGTIGVVSLVPKNIDGFAFGSFMIKFNLKENSSFDNNFLSYYLNCKLLIELIEREKIGAIQGNITIPIIKSILTPIPPLPIQKEIVDHITNIRQQAKALQNEAKTAIEEAKRTVEDMILG